MMRIVLRWIIGIGVGTLLVAITSPVFVRSYVPRQINRGRVTLPTDADYRWRSEGYATTAIGPLGMPGQTQLSPRQPGVRRVALWGDSQAEGVCVDDRDKIFAITQRLMAGNNASGVDVFPLAHSGDDLTDWLPQMPWAEREIDVDAHVILVTELTDLRPDAFSPTDPDAGDVNGNGVGEVAVEVEVAVDPRQNWMAQHLPAFVIQSARHLITEDDETPRRLRFGLGPARPFQTVAPENHSDDREKISDAIIPATVWTSTVAAIADQTDAPVVLVYAPVLPSIVAGRIIWDDADDDDFQILASVAGTSGMTVVDVRDDFRQSAIDGDWTHGYHNGQFGQGHLNRTGNAIIARRLSQTLAEMFDATTPGN